MLIKMIDGGLVNYEDDHDSYGGCPTCDYGSEYINEINLTLTQYRIYAKTNKMSRYALSEGQMIKLFLSEYNTIQTMTEKEFVDWFKKELSEISGYCIEEFDVTEIKEN